MTDETAWSGEPGEPRYTLTLMDVYAFVTGAMLGVALVMGLAGIGLLG